VSLKIDSVRGNYETCSSCLTRLSKIGADNKRNQIPGKEA
jgi:hypothetical protein